MESCLLDYWFGQLYRSGHQPSKRRKTKQYQSFHAMHADHTIIRRILTLREFLTWALRATRETTPPLQLRGVICICDVQSPPHESNTSNVAKKLTFKRCRWKTMFKNLDLVFKRHWALVCVLHTLHTELNNTNAFFNYTGIIAKYFVFTWIFTKHEPYAPPSTLLKHTHGHI